MGCGKAKRILLVNPVRQDSFQFDRIHMGLSIIGEILVSNGHEVKLIDYAFLKSLNRKIRVPNIEEVIYEFKPDLIGITVFTSLYSDCQNIIKTISQCSDVPIILGGPHFAIFPDDFSDDSRISYIVRGEAEKVILNLIETAKREHASVFIDSPIPSADEIPAVNLDVAYGSQYLKVYQIQLSRGCPFNCSFCCVRYVAGHKIRARNLDTCLKQIIEAKRRYVNINTIVITDDCPNFDKERFKRFLQMFKEANTGCRLSIDNMRANLIDEEMIQVYKAAGGQNVCLGIESGHHGVFKLIDKGESLENIVEVAKLTRKYRLVLGLCFVIGLPEDNLKRHAYSMRLAKVLKPDYIFWNMCIPWPGTKVCEWYKTHGKVENLRNFISIIDSQFDFEEPVCESYSFSKKDMIKAWLMANMETNSSYFTNSRNISKLILLAYRYKIYRSTVIYFTKYFIYFIKYFLSKCKHFILDCGLLIISLSCLMYGLLHRLPGVRFDLYGRVLSIKAFLKRLPTQHKRMLLNPVQLLRYFEFDFVKRCLSELSGGKLLDISSPRLLPLWVANSGKFQVIMVNLNINDLEESRQFSILIRNRDKLKFVAGVDATQLPFLDNSFNIATSISIIEHINGNGDSIAMNEFVRVVRPGGKIILTFPVLGNYFEEYRASDPYGTQERDIKTGLYFFQRFYDVNSINSRILGGRKVRVIHKEYFDESFPGRFDSYVRKSIQEGLNFTVKDPWLILKLFTGPINEHPQDRMGNCHLVLEVIK